MILYITTGLSRVCQCVASRVSLTQMGYSGLKPTRPEGGLLTNGEPRRSQRALSGGLHPNLRDRGNFPIEMRSRCLSFSVSLLRCCTDSVSVSLPQSVKPGPPSPRGRSGGTWAPWEGWLSPSPITWRRSPFFVGGTALGTELWAHGAGPRALNFLMEKHKQDLIKTSCSGNPN